MQQISVSRRGFIGSLGLVAGSMALPRMAWASAAAEARFPTVAGMLDGYVSSGKLPGMIAALGWGASEAPMDIARGTLAKGMAPAIEMDSLFRIYSMTKPITGMAAMMLAQMSWIR